MLVEYTTQIIVLCERKVPLKVGARIRRWDGVGRGGGGGVRHKLGRVMRCRKGRWGVR